MPVYRVQFKHFRFSYMNRIQQYITFSSPLLKIELIKYFDLLLFFLGHTRKISIPGCVEFHMTTNACRGFCESWAVPSGPKSSVAQPVTSIGQCCNMMETEPVDAVVRCIDGNRTYTFKSAVTCACYHCKKE